MPRCKGKTQDGSRCRILVKDGEQYCHYHKSQRGFILRRVVTVTALIPLLVAIGHFANVTADVADVLKYLGINSPLFPNNSQSSQAPGNSITAGRDIKDNTIIQSAGDLTLNENHISSATIVSGNFSLSPSSTPPTSSTVAGSNQLFLSVIYNDP